MTSLHHKELSYLFCQLCQLTSKVATVSMSTSRACERDISSCHWMFLTFFPVQMTVKWCLIFFCFPMYFPDYRKVDYHFMSMPHILFFLLWIASSHASFIFLFGYQLYWLVRIWNTFWLLILFPNICCKYLLPSLASLLTWFMGLVFCLEVVFVYDGM